MNFHENMIGQIFGELTIVNLSSSTEIATYWDCECSCGNPFLGVKEEYLIEHKSVSCVKCKQKNYLDSFLTQAQYLYGDKYSFIIPEDFKMGKDITIVCREHGPFLKRPTYFLQKPGCKKCLAQKKAKASFEKFVEKSNILHDGFYDYSVSEAGYQSVSSKIDIICPRHGVFNTRAALHLNGHQCPKCVHYLTSKDFAEKANEIHNFKYEYSLVEYKGSFGKVKIVCKEHGVFEQTPSSHFQGAGCPKCSSLARAFSFVDRYTIDPEKGQKEGFLYLMEVEGSGERFLKVGISTELRKRINAYRREENYNFRLIKSWTTTRLVSSQVEDLVLSWKKSENLHYWPRKNFDGRSECIQIEYQDKVIYFIENSLTEYGHIPER